MERKPIEFIIFGNDSNRIPVPFVLPITSGEYWRLRADILAACYTGDLVFLSAAIVLLV